MGICDQYTSTSCKDMHLSNHGCRSRTARVLLELRSMILAKITGGKSRRKSIGPGKTVSRPYVISRAHLTLGSVGKGNYLWT